MPVCHLFFFPLHFFAIQCIVFRGSFEQQRRKVKSEAIFVYDIEQAENLRR